MAPGFHLLAHSHGVAFLDAATDWRSRVKLAGTPDPRFGATFQGWFGGTLPARPMELAFLRPGAARTLVAWVMPPGGPVGHLVEMVPGPDGAPMPRVNPAYVEVLREWRGKGPIVSMIRGNEHALAMLARFPPYDFVDPEVRGSRHLHRRHLPEEAGEGEDQVDVVILTHQTQAAHQRRHPPHRGPRHDPGAGGAHPPRGAALGAGPVPATAARPWPPASTCSRTATASAFLDAATDSRG